MRSIKIGRIATRMNAQTRRRINEPMIVKNEVHPQSTKSHPVPDHLLHPSMLFLLHLILPLLPLHLFLVRWINTLMPITILD
jgi:hypothetical protein